MDGKEDKMRERYFPAEENQEIKSRANWLLGFLVVVLFLYLMRACALQVNQGDYFKGLADNNRIRAVPMPAPRGLIYDRHGTLLVNNIPEFNLYAVLGDMPDPDAVLNRLTRFVALDPLGRVQQERGKGKNRFSPVKLKGGLSIAEIARIEGNLWNLPGIHVTAELKRHSLYGTLAAHSIGYIGEISKAQIASGRFPDIDQGNQVGQFGMEQTYDATLRGHPGKKWIEVDALGQALQSLRVKKPVAGNDLFLTLDYKLQRVAEEALGEEAGSIIAMNPNNGEILAMVSHPPFDPNLFSEKASPGLLKALLAHPQRPLLNRAISGQYAPGSVFKIVVSAAALEKEEALLKSPIECRGSFPFGNRTFLDWKREGHGSVTLHRALVESCDVYYYTMGNRLGVDTMAQFAHGLGLGMPTGVRLANEKPGLIPSTSWKKKRLEQPWYPGETLSVAIGQGYVLVTPLQMAVMMAAVANDGTIYRPRLFLKSRDRSTRVLWKAVPEKGRAIPISKETLTTIKKALVDVVATPQGTAARARSTLVSFAGKTGTAQVVSLPRGKTKETLPKHLNDHAWFVSYAPVDDPTLVVVVLVEHGGHGGSAAAPLAKKVIETYWTSSPSPPEQRPLEASNPVKPPL